MENNMATIMTYEPKQLFLKVAYSICVLICIPCVILSIFSFGLMIACFGDKDYFILMAVLTVLGITPMILVFKVPKWFKSFGLKTLKKITNNNVNMNESARTLFFSMADDLALYFDHPNKCLYFVPCGRNDDHLTISYKDFVEYEIYSGNGRFHLELVFYMNNQKEKMTVRINPKKEWDFKCAFEEVMKIQKDSN